jgi:hypothetical protein
MIKISIPSSRETIEIHVQRGWQCAECYGIQIDKFKNRFGGVSEDRFECRECGATWHRG